MSRLTLLIAAMLATLAVPAQAATRHALIMWIGTYAEPSAKLQGIDRDAEAARQMARLLGVPKDQVLELSNEKLEFAAMRQALRDLSGRVKPGDQVFLYFSGHGARSSRAGHPGCQEGLVTREGRLMMDAVLVNHLEELAQRASRVLMLTDTCHAGGVASKSLDFGLPQGAQSKVYPLPLRPALPDALTGQDGTSADACSVQVNRGKALNLSGVKVVHLGAAGENEAAFATPQGSLATQAWLQCLQGDTRRTGRELADCAQRWVDREAPWARQTITPSRSPDLMLMDD